MKTCFPIRSTIAAVAFYSLVTAIFIDGRICPEPPPAPQFLEMPTYGQINGPALAIQRP